MRTYRKPRHAASARLARLGLLTLALTGTIAGGVAVGASDPGNSAAPSASAQAEVVASSVSAQQLGAFRALHRAVTAADAVSERSALQLQETLAVREQGMNVGLARRADTQSGAVWIAPGNGDTCILMGDVQGQGAAASADAGVVSCMADEKAAAGELAVSLARTERAGVHQFVAGLVPDDVELAVARLSDGSTRALPIRDNVYASSFDGVTVESVTLTGPSGDLVVTP